MPQNQEPENGWKEWSKYVLKELERLSKAQKEMNDTLILIQRDIAGLQVKAGLWGAAAGAIPVLVMWMLKM